MKINLLAMAVVSLATTVPASAEILKNLGTNWNFLLYKTAINNAIDPANADADFHTTWYDPAALGYNGPAFTAGTGYFGYGVITGSAIATNIWLPGSDPATNVPPSGQRYTAYFVTTVTPTQPISNLRFSGIIDDGAIIYVNGTEFDRINMDPVAPDAWALLSAAGGSETAVVSAVAPINLPANVPIRIGVSVHSTSATSSDMGFDFEIESVVPTTAPNDNFADAIEIVGDLPVIALGTNSDGLGGLGSTKEPGEPNHAGDAGGGSVWWKWTPTTSGRVSLSTAGSTYNTLLAVYTGTAVNALTPVSRYQSLNVPASSADEPFWPASRVEFNAVAGTTYRIAVGGAGGAAGDITLTLDAFFSPLDPVALLLPARSDWEYLLYADAANQPVDPQTVDPDFDATWHTAARYNGPIFSGPAPALLGYGLIDADPIVTDIWEARDHGGATAADNLIPPTGLRYAAYFRTIITPTAPVANLAFDGLIDDGAIIYINGVESARLNVAAAKDANDWTVFADGTDINGVGDEDAPQVAFALGKNLPANQPVEIAVSVHNPNATSSDLGFDLRIYSSNPPLIPPVPVGFNVLVKRTAVPGEYELSWPNTPGATYDVNFSEDLENWITIIFDLPADPSGTNTQFDFPNLPEGYYQVIQR